MRRIVIWLGSTVTVVVLLFGYHTSTNATTDSSGSSVSTAPAPSATSSSPSRSSSGSSSGSGGSDPDPSPSASKSSTSSKSSSTAAKNYTGSVASTRWGPVQVQITVGSGNVTDVAVVQSPQGNHKDLEINAHALPILVQETIDQQSASIDMVSGATVTSTGYVKSLQAALNDAGL